MLTDGRRRHALMSKIDRRVGAGLFLRFLSTEPVSRRFGYDRGTPIDRYYIENFLALTKAKINLDGLIEAIRLEGKPYVLGVQWHPEFHPPGNPDLLDCNPILDEFLTAARGRRW